MEAMQWLTLIVFGLTILAVITNVIDSTLAALITDIQKKGTPWNRCNG